MIPEPAPLYGSGDRVVVSPRSHDGIAREHSGDTGAVLDSFPNGHRLGYEVLLDQEELIEIDEGDLTPEY